MCRAQIKQAIAVDTPDAIALVDDLSDDAIALYKKLLRLYFSGVSTPDGWLWCIESNLQGVGVGDRLAFAMANVRDWDGWESVLKEVD